MKNRLVLPVALPHLFFFPAEMTLPSEIAIVSPVSHTATHCNTLQHTATHCNTLQHAATHCNTACLLPTPPGYDTFHWNCYTHKMHQIQKLKFLGISWYKFKLRFWFNLNRYPSVWVFGFGGFRGCNISSGKLVDVWGIYDFGFHDYGIRFMISGIGFS